MLTKINQILYILVYKSIPSIINLCDDKITNYDNMSYSLVLKTYEKYDVFSFYKNIKQAY